MIVRTAKRAEVRVQPYDAEEPLIFYLPRDFDEKRSKFAVPLDRVQVQAEAPKG